MGKTISDASAKKLKRVTELVLGTPRRFTMSRGLGGDPKSTHSLWAVITERFTPSGGCTPWGWDYQQDIGCTWDDPYEEGPSDRTNTIPAYEIDGKEASVGEMVRLWRGAGDYMLFSTPTLIIKGKLDGTLNQGSSATMSRWVWNGASEADNGVNVTVYDWLLASGQTIASGIKVVATWIDGRYYVTSAECP